MHLLIVLFYVGLALGLIFYWRFFELPGIKPRAIAIAFLLKLIAGYALAFIYTHHYENRRSGDAYRFFDDGVILHSSFNESPKAFARLMTGIGMETDPVAEVYYHRMTHMQLAFYTGYPNDNATIIRANALALFLSGGYYHVHTVIWCFLALIGLTALLKIFLRHFPDKKWLMFLSVYLLPTVLFWSSGVLKEPLLLLGLGLFLLGFFRWFDNEFTKKDIAPLLIGITFLLFTKGYIIQCMAPGLAFLVFLKLNKGKRFNLSIILPHVLTVLLIFLGPYLANGLKVNEIVSDRQTAFYNVAHTSNSGSIIDLPKVTSSFDVVKNVPEAVLISYFRPWPWEWTKPLFIPAALENLFLIVCLIIMIYRFKLPSRTAWPLCGFALSFILVFGGLAGQVVPVLGALVRYKLPALIFLFVLIFSCTDTERLIKKFPFFRSFLRKPD